jgi:hypothetical protein
MDIQTGVESARVLYGWGPSPWGDAAGAASL